MKNRNRQNTEMFSDISQIDPSEFYAQKRENKTNHFAIIDDRKMNSGSRRNFQPEPTSFLDSFEVAISDPKTKQIFADVDEYDNRRKKMRSSSGSSREQITNEILSVDLANDDTFINDVFDSYDSGRKYRQESFDYNTRTREVQNDRLNKKNHRTMMQDDDFISEANRPSLNDFVPTHNVTDEKNIKGDQKIDSIASALDDVSQRHSELQHSIQIVLDDVNKHKEYDDELQSNLLKHTSNYNNSTLEKDITEERINTLFDENLDINDRERGLFDSEDSFKPMDKSLRTAFEFNDLDDEKRQEAFMDSDFSRSFKNKYDFEFTDNTTNAKRFSEDFKPLFDDKYLMKQDTSEFKMDRAQNENDQMHSLIVSNQGLKHQSASEENLLLQEENLKQLEAIESQKRELEMQRQQLEEERQKMADEFMEMSEREREALSLERGKIIEEAYRQKEELIANAKAEIDLERKQLQEENDKLRQSLAETIRENQEFIDEQRNALIEAANKEKERLIEEHRNATKQVGQQTLESITPEAQANNQDNQNASLLNEIRDLVEQIREVKESDEQKFEQLKHEISDETRNAVAQAINVDDSIVNKIEKISSEQKENFEELSKKLDEVKQQDEIDAEMEAITVNRSYTEKIIDDIETDDPESEHEYIPIKTIQVPQDYDVTHTAQDSSHAPTSEFNDVQVMRSALNVPVQNDFDFEQKRLEYQKDKVKDEIKREILQEIERMNAGVVELNSSIPTSHLSTEELEIDATSHIEKPEPKVTLLASETIPELINRHEPEKAKAATRMYDFDLFDELGIEAFETNDTAIVKAITEQIANNLPPIPSSVPQVETITYESNVNFRPQKTVEVPKSPLPVVTPEPQVPKLRAAQLVFNKKGKYENLSKTDLVKNYAKDIKKKLERKKVTKF